MNRLLVVVFDAESKAYEAKKALHELDKEDVITVFDQPNFSVSRPVG